MKTISFLIFLAVALILDAQAQTTSRAGFQIKFPDSSRKAFFEQHRNVDSIVVIYRNNRAADLNLIFRENGQELLDLTFEGDRYILGKKYKALTIPAFPSLSMQYLNGISNITDSIGLYRAKAFVRRNYVVYEFSYSTSTNRLRDKDPREKIDETKKATITETTPMLAQRDLIVRDTIFGKHARFKGSLSKIQEKLNKDFKQWNISSTPDSTLVISGVVTKKGILQNLRLKYGSPSNFSNKIEEFILMEMKGWWPGYRSQPVNDLVSFFVRLNPNNSISFILRTPLSDYDNY